MAAETERAKTSLEQRLVEQQNIAAAQSKGNFAKLISAANTAAYAVQLDEADTRKIIDQQLKLAGWEADSEALKYNKGSRPEKNRNRAIAEWPTESGPADYVLFIGLTPVAVVEAKRKNVDVSGALQQTKRYSRTFIPSTETTLPAENWGNAAAYRIPFAFSSNGRPFSCASLPPGAASGSVTCAVLTILVIRSTAGTPRKDSPRCSNVMKPRRTSN